MLKVIEAHWKKNTGAILKIIMPLIRPKKLKEERERERERE
jgi:hypothetical protein